LVPAQRAGYRVRFVHLRGSLRRRCNIGDFWAICSLYFPSQASRAIGCEILDFAC